MINLHPKLGALQVTPGQLKFKTGLTGHLPDTDLELVTPGGTRTLALLYYANDRDPVPWIQALNEAGPEIEVRQWPDTGRAGEIDYALLWNPPPTLFEKLSGLKVIFSLGAGVDHLLRNPELPDHLPLVRVTDTELSARMTEYLLMHVLIHQRRQRDYDALQKQRKWQPLPQPPASRIKVGIMGLGVLGQQAATHLRLLGFKVAGWSRTRKNLEGIACFSGEPGLTSFLNVSEILICLLPITEQTQGILNYRVFSKLARGEIGPVLINAGRGALQVEEDILEALKDGTLKAATLDTFQQEPLPPESPLWSHPRVTVTPHNAATSDPRSIAAFIIRQIRGYESGKALENQVDRKQGY
ncbi:MAG: glyoxylate/hydroxypyruvate reductase A [Gammaproteobacteria bacterium]|nr:glyoxylate/hydroxypyruvate reductase A [Gammaproteobacteria bacterium]